MLVEPRYSWNRVKLRRRIDLEHCEVRGAWKEIPQPSWMGTDRALAANMIRSLQSDGRDALPRTSAMPYALRAQRVEVSYRISGTEVSY